MGCYLHILHEMVQECQVVFFRYYWCGVQPYTKEKLPKSGQYKFDQLNPEVWLSWKIHNFPQKIILQYQIRNDKCVEGFCTNITKGEKPRIYISRLSNVEDKTQ